MADWSSGGAASVPITPFTFQRSDSRHGYWEQNATAIWKKRLTGADLDTNDRWHVAGTDLGIPYILENGSQ
jgi:hypothetical protein